MDVLSGTIESIIDNQLGEIAELYADFNRRWRALQLQGHSPLRAAYIINGQPLGKNRKAMKRWIMGRREADRRLDRDLRMIRARRDAQRVSAP